MKSNEIARLGLIIIAACVFLYLINEYNRDNTKANNSVENVTENFEEHVGEHTHDPNGTVHQDSEDEEDKDEAPSPSIEGFFGSGSGEVEDPTQMPQNNGDGNESDTGSDVMPSDGENNASFGTVAQGPNNDNQNQDPNRLPNECYPRDTLTPRDLLPSDANSSWAQVVPNGQGNLGDQNFLNAGHHVGINTVGQSLRNANLQLRSEPANPQLKVSPWLQTTIEPDINRRAMEIGA